jgi:outer membrane protein assembly factor BamD (BamD/ComL family)
MPADSLPEEVRLLTRAEQELKEGRTEDALKTLGEHEHRFSAGALSEERLAARVQALCTLGRGADARKELTRLARLYPRSPHIERARRFCGMDAASTP